MDQPGKDRSFNHEWLSGKLLKNGVSRPQLRSAQRTNKNQDKRLTGSNPGLYCAPFQLKRDFRDFPAIDGV